MKIPHEPLVTIGIPTYNRPAGLERTLRAITAQTYQNLEIVISDNCSPDEAVQDIAQQFVARDARVTYFRQETNIGAVGNFFALLDLAKGDYFMWAADDDWWDNDFVEVSVGLLLENPNAAVAVTAFEPLPDPDGKPRLLPLSYEKIREFSEPDTCRRLLRYIAQKDAFGKAHIAYGVFPTGIIRESVGTLKRIVEPVMPVAEFEKVDVFLNAVVLSHGDLVTSDRCLRKYSAGPRKSVGGIKPRLRGSELTFANGLEFMRKLVWELGIPESEKDKLLRGIKQRAIRYRLERIGRKALIYKLYWSIYKRLRFRYYR